MSKIRPKLSKPPLKEVIFEIHWQLSAKTSGQQYDPFYEFGKGVFYEKVKVKFPFKKDVGLPLLPTANIRVINSPLHQFWTSENKWPLIQLGEGILTVNDTDPNYKWETNFRDNIDFALEHLKNSNENPFRFTRLELKYIDAVDVSDTESKDWLKFIKDNLGIELKVNHRLPADNHHGVAINQTFRLKDNSELVLIVTSGRNNKTLQPALVWQTSISKIGDPIKYAEIMPWAEIAHDEISALFHDMLSEQFYALFK